MQVQMQDDLSALRAAIVHAKVMVNAIANYLSIFGGNAGRNQRASETERLFLVS